MAISLVDLHKAAAHFPIALLLSSVFFDIAGAALRRPHLRETAYWTCLLGAVGAGVAVLFGVIGNPYQGVTGELGARMSYHEDLGMATFGFFAIFALVRVWLRYRRVPVPAVVYWAAAAVGVFAVAATGYLGGHLFS